MTVTVDPVLQSWAASDEAADLRIQFQRIDRLLEGLPGASELPIEVQAAILGVSPERFATQVSAHAQRVSDAVLHVAELPATAVVREAYRGETILCFGDSITADRDSWAEILRGALAPDVTVLNRGRSGDTTGDLLTRFASAVGRADAGTVITMAGTNDARRYGSYRNGVMEFGSLAISDGDTATNFVQLDGMIRGVTGRSGIWMSPPPLDDARIREHPSPRCAELVWRTDDLVRKTSILHRLFPARTTSAATAFASTGDVPALLLDDGLHPNAEGQLVLARTALTALASAV